MNQFLAARHFIPTYVTDARGAPSIVFHNFARELCSRSGVTHAHLSLSHTATYAIAYLILEKN